MALKSDDVRPANQLLEFISDPSWFETHETREIFVRYYVPVSIRPEQLELRTAWEEHRIEGVPVRLVIARITDQAYASFHPAWTSLPDGSTALPVERIERVLPDSLYVLLSSPLAPVQDWQVAARRMDELAALLRYAFGTNFLYQVAREAIVDVTTGNMTTPTPVIPTPQPGNGPTLSTDDRELLTEVLAAIEGQAAAQAGRIHLALELFERGVQQVAGTKFFYYWIGVEILCDTYQKANVLAKLAEAYGASRSYVQNDLGFDRIWTMRSELFHHGRHHDMPQDVERYVQSMFMDLLRSCVGLPCRRHMESLVQAGFVVERLQRQIGTSNVLTIDARDDNQSLAPEQAAG